MRLGLWKKHEVSEIGDGIYVVRDQFLKEGQAGCWAREDWMWDFKVLEELPRGRFKIKAWPEKVDRP